MPEPSSLNRSYPSTNPQSVLNSIGAGRGAYGQAAVGPLEPAEFHRHETSARPTLKIVRGHEQEAPQDRQQHDPPRVKTPATKVNNSEDVSAQTNEDILMSTIESAKQIQQLAMRLEQFQRELVERERELEAQNRQWQVAVQQCEFEFDRRVGQLQQQTAQTRLQQRHVMQLQSDVVQSYEAAKIAIEGVVTSDADLTLQANMKALKQELGSRFDYIARRWEHLHGLLENQRVNLEAAQAVDDRVEWT